MSEDEALTIARKIMKRVFGMETDIGLEEILNKFAFDKDLPKKVYDSIDGTPTYADAINNRNKFITLTNSEKRDSTTGWMLDKKSISNLDEIIEVWETINYTTTERIYDSINVSKSDTVYRSENVYNSTDLTDSKNILFCSSVHSSEYMIASSRSIDCEYSIRVDDSKNCSGSYNVICSNKIVNSLFIDDCFDLYECMFCSHIASKKYCIANMQFESDEYYVIKNSIIEWILNS